MKILVMGAGAVGAYFGARMRAAGEDVVLCARGDNLRAIRERGLDLTSIRGDLRIGITATDNPRDFAPYDLILFCVKAYDTDAAAQSVSGCLNSGGVMLTLQNGVENEAKLATI
jgi:2-dehydropantoate 2-reductase